jgi:hypothetical protein
MCCRRSCFCDVLRANKVAGRISSKGNRSLVSSDASELSPLCDRFRMRRLCSPVKSRQRDRRVKRDLIHSQKSPTINGIRAYLTCQARRSGTSQAIVVDSEMSERVEG